MLDSASIGMIGGADGPTAIMVTDGFGRINGFGLLLVVLLLIPNIVYAIRTRGDTQPASAVPRALEILEQVGRYGCMFLTVFDFGRISFGFLHPALFFAALFGCPLLLLGYYAAWLVFFRRRTRPRAMILTVLPCLLFLLFGIALSHPLLVLFALLFGVCHVRVSWMNGADLPK